MRSACTVALVIALAASAAHAQSDAPGPGDRLTRAELERAIYDYADRYAAQIVSASDAIAREFLPFVLSTERQEMVKSLGAFPIPTTLASSQRAALGR